MRILVSDQANQACTLRVLVVEDEYFIADDLAQALAHEGMAVLGPISNREEALAALAALAGGEPVDGAILDVNLGGTMVFEVAAVLADRGIPFGFATGYDAGYLTDFRDVPHWPKPFDAAAVARALRAMIGR